MRLIPQKQIRDVILDSIVDGVFTVDENWRITSFNRAAEEITGVPSEDAIGQRCSDVFHASICENECALKEALGTGHPIICKPIYIVKADGHRVPVSISATALKDQKGYVIGGVETFRDLTVIEQLRKELQDKYTFADIVARSSEMRRILDILPRLADSDSTVLIEGASGTGKELVARAIHDLSPRSKKRFVALNCGALPDTLLESELFGYKAGAFTDARKDKPGRFAAAMGGTIFLDEISDVSPAMQSKLLRVLQERVYEPLGSVDPVAANVRIIAASNQDLGTLVKKGGFREDLFYRVNVMQIQLPPLRDRREDIPLLVEHFVSKFNRLQQKNIAGVSEEVMAILLEYDYPGNIRELENIIEHAFVLCRGGLLKPAHLPTIFQNRSPWEPFASDRELTLRSLVKMHITNAIQRHGGNRKAAAKGLGIHPSTLFRKIKLLNIELPEKDGRSRIL
ncbi:MAG: sigma 54-interacting transcriptional regulator [Pirellulales bacterium]|nr:sigma 54-interacting transcriptional regulator [Pirellulales bacterium]